MQRTIRLLHLTDTHLLGNPAATLRGINPLTTLQAVRAAAAEQFPDPHGILLTGDLVQDDADGYQQVLATFGREPRPVYCLPGNHDVLEAMHQTLNRPPFVLADHVQLDGWLLVMLNSAQANSAAGRLGADQLERLASLLTRHPQQHTLICLHHHPIAMGSQWLDEVGLADGEAFQQLVAAHPQVRGVIWGHVHQARDELRRGVRWLSTPATCSQFLPGSRDFALDDKPPAWRTLELDPDGTLRSEVVWLNTAVAERRA